MMDPSWKLIHLAQAVRHARNYLVWSARLDTVFRKFEVGARLPSSESAVRYSHRQEPRFVDVVSTSESWSIAWLNTRPYLLALQGWKTHGQWGQRGHFVAHPRYGRVTLWLQQLPCSCFATTRTSLPASWHSGLVVRCERLRPALIAIYALVRLLVQKPCIDRENDLYMTLIKVRATFYGPSALQAWFIGLRTSRATSSSTETAALALPSLAATCMPIMAS